MKQDIFPQARQNEIVVQESNDEVLVYDLKTNKVFCLNETSASIWQLCDGKKDVQTITNQFQKQKNQQIPIELVEIALEKLSKEELLENYQSPLGRINKQSRREMIRRVGLATVIALPIINSVIAPSSVSAQSVAVCPPGETYCPQTSIGFTVSPEGCKDLQNGSPTLQCGACHLYCIASNRHCVGGLCVLI